YTGADGLTRYAKATNANGVDNPWRLTHFSFVGSEWLCTAEAKNLSSSSSTNEVGGDVEVEGKGEGTISTTSALLKWWKRNEKNPKLWDLDTCVYDAHWKPISSLLSTKDVTFTASKDGYVKRWAYAKAADGRSVWQTVGVAKWRNEEA
ncbi:unnamed protein product, partial [Amoebophrya sp. A25]